MAIALAYDLYPPSWLGHPVELHRSHKDHGPNGKGRSQIGQWTLDVKHDPFTGTVSCALRAPRMSFEHAAVSFRFWPSIDTFDAMYRIDSGPAYSWRISALALAAHGVKLQADDARNPSGGKVTVPYNALIGGKTIWVRPSPEAAATPFKIDDLPAAVAAARSQGCTAEFAGAPTE
ncbi:MAG TPA: hypothetical protein VGI79_15210 [Caulobacteraceae bacterium]|jgi:hypothetical protein